MLCYDIILELIKDVYFRQDLAILKPMQLKKHSSLTQNDNYICRVVVNK